MNRTPACYNMLTKRTCRTFVVSFWHFFPLTLEHFNGKPASSFTTVQTQCHTWPEVCQSSEKLISLQGISQNLALEGGAPLWGLPRHTPSGITLPINTPVPTLKGRKEPCHCFPLHTIYTGKAAGRKNTDAASHTQNDNKPKFIKLIVMKATICCILNIQQVPC